MFIVKNQIAQMYTPEVKVLFTSPNEFYFFEFFVC